MNKWLTGWFANMVTLAILDMFFDSIAFGSVGSLVICSFILVGLNIFIKPVLKFMALPISFMTLGLFSIVINILIFVFAFSLVDGAYITHQPIILMVIVLIFSFINSIVTQIFKEKA